MPVVFYIFNGITIHTICKKYICMKSKVLLLAAIAVSLSASAQIKVVEYKYKDNSLSVAEQDKRFTNTSTGKLFYTRLKAFDSFSRKSILPYISREDFVVYLNNFNRLSKLAKANGYDNHVVSVQTLTNNISNLSKLSNEDGFRHMLYRVSKPVYQVIEENWGNDVVDAVIRESYLRLYDYTKMKVRGGDAAFAHAMEYLDMDPIKTDESMGQCQYTVSIDQPVLAKDDIEVYFSDLALFKKISEKYPSGLLEGPIAAWQAYKDESNIVRSLLMAYEGEREIPAYYSYMYHLKEYGNPSTIQQNLFKDNKWFVWVFRSGILYYSYMALPCSDISKVTVYEERVQEGLQDPESYVPQY